MFARIIVAVGLLGGCVAAPARVAGPPVPLARDNNCAEERQEARVADRVADRERREARFGGARQDYEAAAARSDANRQRAQAARAC